MIMISKGMNNHIIGVMGKKGSGKTVFVQESLKNMKRYIVVDTLHEYNGAIFYNWIDIVCFIDEVRDIDFNIIYRPLNDEDREEFFELINVINNYTLVVEEIDFYCDSHNMHPELDHLTRYGRHYNRSLIWITRNPFEVNRFLTRQSDVLVTFKQTEPRDLDYFKKYNFNKEIETLKEYEYAFWGDEQIVTNVLNKKIA